MNPVKAEVLVKIKIYTNEPEKLDYLEQECDFDSIKEAVLQDINLLEEPEIIFEVNSKPVELSFSE